MPNWKDEYEECAAMHDKAYKEGLVKTKKPFKATLTVTISGTSEEDFNPRYVVDEINEAIKQRLNEKQGVFAKAFTAIRRVYL